jgi:RES domain-containing protein
MSESPQPSNSSGAAGALRLWRLVKTQHIASAFDGEGAFRYGGRWNSRGQRVVYASSTLSLAVLEVLVHLDPAGYLPELHAISIDVPIEEIRTHHFSKQDSISGGLPWQLAQTRAWGDVWARERGRPALEVPSAIVPNESNYLLSPTHPRFAQLEISAPEQFPIDARLFST